MSKLANVAKKLAYAVIFVGVVRIVYVIINSHSK